MDKFSKDINYYLNLPYTIEVVRDNDEENPGYVAIVAELPGCITQGDTFEELGEMIEDAMRGWLEVALEDGMLIPEPRPVEDFSGKFVVRLPKSLHRELTEIAERENVSLNAFVSASLGKSVGRSTIEPEPLASFFEPSPIVAWPKLSEQARRILLVNGFENEAQEVNEIMFAGWIEDHLNQINAAIQQGYYREGMQYIQRVRQALDMLCGLSPLITTYCQFISLLETQVKENISLREGLIEQSFVKSRISAQTKTTTKSYVADYLKIEDNEVFMEKPENLSENDYKLSINWYKHAKESK